MTNIDYMLDFIIELLQRIGQLFITEPFIYALAFIAAFFVLGIIDKIIRIFK